MAVNSNLAKSVALIVGQIRAKNEAAAILVENRAKARCPVDTGALRASITHDSDEGGFIVGTNKEYGPFVELGTIYQSPQAYLVPAVQENMSELIAVYQA